MTTKKVKRLLYLESRARLSSLTALLFETKEKFQAAAAAVGHCDKAMGIKARIDFLRVGFVTTKGHATERNARGKRVRKYVKFVDCNLKNGKVDVYAITVSEWKRHLKTHPKNVHVISFAA